jgi:collagenase-like PrtC family protease
MHTRGVENLEFSVPYNGDPETLEDVFKLKKTTNNTIREVYLSGPQEYSGSGRVMDEVDLGQFLETVDRIHEEGLRVNLVLNSTCEGSHWYSPEVVRAKMEYLRQVHEEHGVEAVTIANPIYIKEVRRRFPELIICASVLGEIDCVQRAVIFTEAGANIMTPDVNINRNLQLLKEIKKATNAELRLMVNEGCLYKCPFRRFHFDYISHVSQESGNATGHFLPHCHEVISNDPSQFLKSGWIRPEDTKKYREITHSFKIVGRALQKAKVVRAVKAYLEESWDGDLMDIVSSSLGSYALGHGTYLDNKTLGEYSFFEKVTSCGQNCSQCSYCKQVANQLIAVVGFTEEKMEDKGLNVIIDNLEEEGVFA